MSDFSFASIFFSSSAYAQTPGGAAPGGATGGPEMLISFIPFIFIFVLFYFLLVRPQQQKAKQRKAMIDNLKKGDRVTTTGGLIGTVTNFSADMLTLQIADGVRVKVVRSYVQEMYTGDSSQEPS
jgi:preprotein translocase subunit YajC